MSCVRLRWILVVLMSSFVGACSEAGTEVSFRTADGFALEARLFQSGGSKGVVLAADPAEGQESYLELARLLQSEGYSALSFNFRGQGASEGRSTPRLSARDVEAAVRFLLEETDVGSVVIIGAEGGGAAAILAAAAVPGVEGIATLSATLEIDGLNAQEAIPRVEGRKLVIAGVDDSRGARDARTLITASLDPTAEVLLVATNDRGTDMLGGRRGEEVTLALLEFLGGALE